MPGGSPIGKISIIARGQAGGFTRWQQEDKSYASQEQLEANYLFKMSGLGRSGEKMTVTKKNRELKQKIPPENYLQPGGFPNRACFRENINEALNIARPDVIF